MAFISHFNYNKKMKKVKLPLSITFKIFGWLISIIFDNHLNQIHALDNESFKCNPFTNFCKYIAYRKFQRSLN